MSRRRMRRPLERGRTLCEMRWRICASPRRKTPSLPPSLPSTPLAASGHAGGPIRGHAVPRAAKVLVSVRTQAAHPERLARGRLQPPEVRADMASAVRPLRAVFAKDVLHRVRRIQLDARAFESSHVRARARVKA